MFYSFLKFISIIFVFLVYFGYAKPAWLNPNNLTQQNFYGIGHAPFSQHPADAKELARRNAVWNLSDAIVDYLDSIYRITNPEMWNSAYGPELLQYWNMYFRNLPAKNIHESKKEIWTLIQISKPQFTRILDSLRQTAITNALNQIKHVEKALDQKKSSQALFSIFRGYRALRYFQFEKLRTKHKYKFLDVRQKLNWELQLMANRLRGKARKDTVAFFPQKQKPLHVHFKFFHAPVKESRIPLGNIPVAFNIKSGDVHYSPFAFTDSKGRVSCIVSKISGLRTGTLLTANLDFARLAGTDTITPLLTYFMQGVRMPDIVTAITLPGKSVFYTVDEKSDGIKSPWNFSALILNDFLDSLRLIRQKDAAIADFIINIKSHSKRGGGTYGIFHALASYQISVLNRPLGRIIYQKELKLIRGEGNTFNKASMNALQKAAARSKYKVLPELEKILR